MKTGGKKVALKCMIMFPEFQSISARTKTTTCNSISEGKKSLFAGPLADRASHCLLLRLVTAKMITN